MWQGELFLYEENKSLAAFEAVTPDFQTDYTVIFIGGLTDGFLTVPFLPRLAELLKEVGVSLTQFVMSSSYRQFGTSSLRQDAQEISCLIEHLRLKRGKSKIFLLGHSTGCQDILVYLRDELKAEHPVYGANLQAPVSDRDFGFWAMPETVEGALSSAIKMIEMGLGDDVLPKMHDRIPMTANRAHDLYCRLGADDFFSLDLTLAECRQMFPSLAVSSHSTFRSLNFTFSLDDEYVPEHSSNGESRSQRVSFLVEKLVQAYPFTKEPILLAGSHNFASHPDSSEAFCQRIRQEILDSFSEQGGEGESPSV